MSGSTNPPPASAFSHADEDVITHEVALDPTLTSASAAAQGRSVEQVYDVPATAARLLGLVSPISIPGQANAAGSSAAPDTWRTTHDHRFNRVALQFPDELLCDAVPVYHCLSTHLTRLAEAYNIATSPSTPVVAPQLYILADTSYGACCVDEVAAAHVEAEALIHFGHACLSRTARLPTLYVFSRLPIDIQQATRTIVDALPPPDESSTLDFSNFRPNNSRGQQRTVALMYQVGYAHAIPELSRLLQEALPGTAVVPEQLDTTVNFEAKLLGRAQGQTALTPEALAAPPSSGTQAPNSICCSCSQESEAAKPDTGCCQSGALASSKDACCGASGTCDPTSSAPLKRETGTDTHATTNNKTNNDYCDNNNNFISSSHDTTSSPNVHTRTLSLPAGKELDQADIVYLGTDSLALSALLAAHPPASRQGAFITFDPTLNQVEHETGRGANRLLMRRYAAVQRAKDARVVALVVGTLGVAAYRPLLAALRSLLTGKGSRRKVYTLAVGKLTPAKLANFTEVDTYVLVACPENSLALAGSASSGNREPPQSKEFLGNIVTPFEMLVALASEFEERQTGEPGSGGWEIGYDLDLSSLYDRAVKEYQERTGRPWAVPGLHNSGVLKTQPSQGQEQRQKGRQNGKHQEGEGTEATEDQDNDLDGSEKSDESEEDNSPIFSLATGRYVTRTAYYPPDELKRLSRNTAAGITQVDDAANGGNQVALRRDDGTVARILDTASSATNPDRAWAGLNPRIGADPPALLEEGRAGFAASYAYADQTPEGRNA